MKDVIENKLKLRSVKPTAMRLLVLQALLNEKKALSLNELETTLEHADRTTIFRTLKTFQEKFLVHRVYDGSGMVKYAVCDDDCNCSLQENHLHFLCTKCSNTYCLKDAPIATPAMPSGFKAKYANYLIEGYCSSCN